MTKEQLLQKFRAREDEGSFIVLDDLVHDAFAAMASNVNNEGDEAQVDWLLANGHTIESIDEALEREGGAQ